MSNALFADILKLGKGPPQHQGLVALATGVARTLVSVHVVLHLVAHHEDLVADRALLVMPGNRW